MADYATLVFDIDSTQARGAAKALGDLNSATIKAANGASRFEKTLRDTNGRFQSTSKYIEDNRAEVERLALAYNPVLAAQIRYRDEAIKTGAAVKAGVITEQQRVDILQRTKVALDASAGAAQRFGAAQQQAGGHTANVFAQLNDIGVMMAAGQNPIQLALQQGTQLNQVWASMGKGGQSLKGVFGVLSGAIGSMLNPMSLLTIGVIAGGAALVQFGSAIIGAGSDSKTFADNISAAETAIARANAASKALASRGLVEIGEKYGIVTAEILSLVEAEKQLGIADGTKALTAALKQLANEALTDRWGVNDQLADLSEAFKISSLQANELRHRLSDIGKMKVLQDQIDALAEIRNELSLVTNGFTNLSPPQKEMLERLHDAEDQARQLLATTNNMPAAFNAAANSASRITDELNRAVSAAARLAASAISDARFAQIELDFRTDSIGKAGAIAAAKFDEEVGKNIGVDGALFNAMRNQAIEGAKEAARIQAEVQRLNDADREAERKANQKSRGGGAAERKASAELKAAEKGFQSLRELLEKESLYQVAEYERRQAQLDNALSKKLISEQNYQLMRNQLQVNYFGSEYERNALQYELDLQQLDEFHAKGLLKEEQYQIAKKNLHSKSVTELGQLQQGSFGQDLQNMSAHFGEMAALAGNYNDKFLRAQKIFGAASALISTYQGAAKALELPFPYNIAAAGKVIAAGMGFISAIKGSGSGGGSSGGSSASTATAVKEEPVRNVLLRLEGDPWLTGLTEQLITQFYEASANGRVIVSRDMN